ncbi:hypothetical protein J7M02_05730 [Candidatus Aerophobetes bacterium]|nr:hypothetical protein [Candidatus Aerophobetes bacterium]
MANKAIEALVKKQLKWYKAQIAVLWLLIGLGAILIPTGIGVYFYVGKLTIVQQFSSFPAKSYIIAQLRMVCIFARVLGIVFSLTGIASIISALDRLSLTKSMHRMASSISKDELKNLP